MAKEEGPLPYQRRFRDTRGVAQRINLQYLKGPAWFPLLRRKVTWIFVAVAAVAAVPLVLGVGGAKKALLPGPLSSVHAFFQERCEACHTQAFTTVPDKACEACHDGAAHPAKIVDAAGHLKATPRCADCHVEHRGNTSLARVPNGNCTRCHNDLKEHGTGLQLTGKSLDITAFYPDKHPEFSPMSRPDTRPIRLNHAKHMPCKPGGTPCQPVAIRGKDTPLICQDCHRKDPASATDTLLPVTFEQDCRSCHTRELEFDVYELIKSTPAPASPHTKDPVTIHQYILTAYQQAMAADPAIVRKPLGNDISPQPSAAAWLDKVVRDSESFLFQRKCNYCHEYAGLNGAYPVVQKVNRIYGRYVADKVEGEPWLLRGEFSHRAHRAVTCESCHIAARASTKTADILIPAMKSCLPCHQESEAGLDRCSTCHLYHNRNLEKEIRRPTQQVLTGASQ